MVISNCVINLSTDKPAVFANTFRVLAPCGRLGVSDVVAKDHLDPAQRGSYVGCIAGALSMREYHDGLAAAGFTITPTHQVAEGMRSAIIRATKPATTHPAASRLGSSANARTCCEADDCRAPGEHTDEPATTLDGGVNGGR